MGCPAGDCELVAAVQTLCVAAVAVVVAVAIFQGGSRAPSLMKAG